MLVESLAQAIELRDDRSADALLGDLAVSADCSSLALGTQHIEFPWDEQCERAIADYLKIPKTYLHRLDPEFRATTVNHHLKTAKQADTVVEWVVKDDENRLIALQRPDRPVMPLAVVGEIIGRCFDPKDEVVQLLRDEKKLHIDVMTSHSIEVPPVADLPDRQIGDITRGGVRILATPHKSTPPIVQGYFHRLVCTNGMTDLRNEGTIHLRGRTLPQVLEELEEAANRILGNMEGKLNEYAEMAKQRVPGNPATFAYRIAQENELSPQVTERIMARAGALPAGHPEVSLYDIANIFTEVAQSGLAYTTQVTMQEAAGHMAFASATELSRCRACEQKI